MSQSPLVVEDLTVRVGSIEVVHQLRFALEAGQRTGLIGESGSGKTLTALAIMGLLPEGLSATCWSCPSVSYVRCVAIAWRWSSRSR